MIYHTQVSCYTFSNRLCEIKPEAMEGVIVDKLLSGIKIRLSEPGDAGYVAYMQGRYYWKHHHFYPAAEYYFIGHLAEFVHDPAGSRLWIAEAEGAIVGSAAIIRVNNDTAQFRWFLVDENYRHRGIGRKLITTALEFCRESGYKHVFLWTFKGLDPARRIYDRAGFVLTEEKVNHEWSSTEIIEQKMDLTLQP